MKVRVRFFAMCREAAGDDQVTLDIPDDSGPVQFWATLIAAYPAMERFEKSSRLAVNQTYAGPDCVLKYGDEVCIIPPVSGG